MTFVVVAALLATLLAVFVLWHRRYGGYMPEPYRSRPCQGFVWKRAFPHSSNDEIRDFLRQFAEAFGYREGQKLQVGPRDRIIEVYRAEYPRTGGVDGLELETLAARMERKYEMNFTALWDETLTFGSLYAACRKARDADGA